MTAGTLRLVRCLLVTGTVVGLAAGAHVLGGGALPAPEIVAALTCLVLASVMQVTGRDLSLGRIAAVLGGSQILLHEAFTVLSTGSACQAAASPAAHQGDHGSALCLSPALAGSAHTVGHDGAGVAMMLAHLLAVAVSALLISRAEAALVQVMAWLRPLMHAPCPVIVGVYRKPRLRPGPDPVAPLSRNLAAVGVRGPPGMASC
ncbi:hypothetical protein [Arthrobacter sp. UNC362MFTsu5.1]|uniref:hypothetical protein n=1 Tax=Arthrobacter sp. UNC362MFTsu5.1 TaxID=1449044 RepID=UPI00068975B3|nr:hypothetical protein [Arthrobacter sp. UNC362MFTsu5.1]